jgi:hypothetical protein
MTLEDYLNDRVDDQISWYEKKGALNKRYHLVSNSLIIIFSSLIPLFAGLNQEGIPEIGYVLAVLGVLTAIATGLSSLFKFHEKWTTYRITAESLRREKILFKTGCGPYDGNNRNLNFLVARIESILSGENEGWSNIINQTDSGSSNGTG